MNILVNTTKFKIFNILFRTNIDKSNNYYCYYNYNELYMV